MQLEVEGVDDMDKEMSSVAAGIMNGLNEVLEDVKGEKTEKLPKTVVYRISAKAVRENLKMSQSEFSKSFGIPLATLRNWEQGRRDMDATAEAYLKTISKFPREAVSAQQ